MRLPQRQPQPPPAMAAARAGLSALLAAALALEVHAIAKELPVVVSTECGQLEGRINGTLYETACVFFPPLALLHPPGPPNVASFLGVPYVAPPIGENRFRPPRPHEAWSGVRKAIATGPVCAQLPVSSMVKVPDLLHPSVQEDCLTLNIWAPVQPDGSFYPGGLPTMVFIHGGGFVGGSSYSEMNCAFYNAQQLAADTGTVIVTMNYRLGVFGWLADPALRSESGTTGNYGLQDQRAAMAWVQRHATKFGIDPKRITLAGQSAGATAVLHHAVLPRSQGLFSKAIAMSGYGLTWTLQEAYNFTDSFAQILSCADPVTRLECFRRKSASELLKAEETMIFAAPGDDLSTRMMTCGPVSDGYETPEDTSFDDVLKAAKPTMPLLIGSTFNESNLLQCGLSDKMNHDEAVAYLLDKIQRFVRGSNATLSDVEHILDAYPTFPDERGALMAFSTDLLFTCTAEQVAQRFTENGAPVYRYLLGRAPAMFQVMSKCYGVPHTSGVFVLFSGSFPKKFTRMTLGNESEQVLAKNMLETWGSFIKDGDPGAQWPRWSNSEEALFQLGNSSSGNFTVVHDYRREACKRIKALVFPNSQSTRPLFV